MFEALHDPIDVMRFGFELADRSGGIGGHEAFLPGFCQDGDLNLPKGAWGHILFEEVHQFEVFVGHFEHRSPDLLSRRWNDAGEAASPLSGPSAEFDRVFRESSQHEEPMLRSATFELRGVEVIPVEKEFHG